MQPERQRLLGGQGALALDQLAQRRALEVLDQQVRHRAVGDGVEAAHDHRMREPRERFGLVAEVAQGGRVGRLVRAAATFATSTASRWSSQTRNTS